MPCTAFAEVLKSDIVTGETVEARGLTIAQCPSIEAESALIMTEDGTVYFERDADSYRKIASITKIMTCLVALDMGTASDLIPVSENAAEIGESSAGLQAGDIVEFQNMLLALMVPSGNDAAIALAEYYGQRILDANGGTGVLDATACVNAFVERMNAKAAELGMTNTKFANPHGLDDGEYEGDFGSTARDIATMVQYGMKNLLFRGVVSTDGCDIAVKRDGETVVITLEPTDYMLSWYEGALGVKTGHTDYAGSCFAGASKRGSTEVYAIILNSSDDSQRFYDAETCMDWLYENLVDVPLVSSAETCQMNIDGTMKTVPIVAYAAHSGWVNCTFPVTLANPDETLEVFRLNGNLTMDVTINDISGDVHAGDIVGSINFYQHNELVHTAQLMACKDQIGPNFLEGIGVWFDRFLRGFTNEPTVAKNQIIATTTILMDKTA
ncbi:MAG: D-alanyl-D-alanine carboxypeptidase [Coriobacteriia bacterium]|nr:D-alanyl-D-alanine carboxypeptidase [Coriobacteriia bacterium]